MTAILVMTVIVRLSWRASGHKLGEKKFLLTYLDKKFYFASISLMACRARLASSCSWACIAISVVMNLLQSAHLYGAGGVRSNRENFVGTTGRSYLRINWKE